MADELIGGIGVTVTADYAPLLAQLDAAEGAARAGGEQIAASLTQGMDAGSEAADRLAAALGGESAAAAASVGSSRAAAAGFEAMAAGAKHGVTEIQALSGGIRVLEGSQGIRAAERFLASIPGIGAAFQAAFPLIGLAAISEMFSRIGEEIHKAFDQAMNAPQVIQSAFRNLNETLHESNDELQLTNDKLRDDIAKIEGHPSNGLMVALDEARVAADKLEISLLKDLTASTKLFADNKENMLEALNLLPGGGSDFAQISQEAQKFQGQIQQTIDKYKTTSAAGNGLQLPKIPGLDKLSGQLQQQEKAKESVELAKQYSAEIDKLSDRLQAAQRHSSGLYTSEVASLEGLIDLYKEQRAQIDLTQQKTGLDKTKAGLPDKGAYRRAEEEQKKADDEALAMLQADHQMTLAETASFWKERLSAESGYTDRVREIHITLGHIYQQSDKAIMEGAKKGDEILKEQENKAKEFVAKMAALAHEADDLGERLHQEDIKRAEEVAKAGAQAGMNSQDQQFAMKKLELARQYGETEGHTAEDQIEYQTKLLALNEAISQAKIVRDQADVKALDPQSQQVAYAEALLKLQQDQNAALQQQYAGETAIAGLKQRDSMRGQLQQQTSPQALAGPLSEALAEGVMKGGKGLGKEIRQSLQGIGKQILGTVFEHAITSLIEKIGIQSAIDALLHIGTGVQVAALTANNIALTSNVASNVALTAAVTALTTAMDINSILGFADGGSPPVGVVSMVGERGPELFIPSVPGKIVTNSALRSSQSATAFGGGGGSGGGTTHQTFNVMTNSPRQTAREISTYIKSQTPKYAPYSSN